MNRFFLHLFGSVDGPDFPPATSRIASDANFGGRAKRVGLRGNVGEEGFELCHFLLEQIDGEGILSSSSGDGDRGTASVLQVLVDHHLGKYRSMK